MNTGSIKELSEAIDRVDKATNRMLNQQGRTDMLNDVCDLLMRECPLLTNGVEVSGWLIRALKEKGGGKV